MIDVHSGSFTLPNDSRAFVHKRIFGGIKGAVGSLVTGGNPLTGGLRGFVSGGRKRTGGIGQVGPGAGGVVPRAAFGNAPGAYGRYLAQPALAGSVVAQAPSRTPCPVGQFRIGNTGACVGIGGISLPRPIASAAFPSAAGGPTGEAVMGRYGAAEVPGSRIQDTAVCRRGMVLGDDDLCYNKRDISNRERMWPAGRKPLMTGGDLNAIARAARVAKKMETQKKRLEKLGLLKKPAPRRKQITSGPREHHHHA